MGPTCSAPRSPPAHEHLTFYNGDRKDSLDSATGPPFEEGALVCESLTGVGKIGASSDGSQ